MSQYGRLAKNSGSGITVAGTFEVFFLSEESANKCAEKYQGEIERLDDGWLVRKKIEPPADDDPVIQAIWKSLREAGLVA